VNRLDDVRHLPAITNEADDLPDDVFALLDAHLLDLGGTYGVPNAGDPIHAILSRSKTSSVELRGFVRRATHRARRRQGGDRRL
jgi:hypothetical protein